MSEQWDLILTFPNLSPPIPTRFESDGYVICSGKDSKLDSLADTPANVTAYKMLTRFRTARSNSYIPGCFLIRADIPISSRDREAIRSFRNLCALATTTATYAIRLKTPHGAQWRVSWSDQFRFGYFTAGKNGWVRTLDGPVIGMDDQIPWMQPAAYFGDPQNWPVYVDDPLLDRLKECWRTCYLRRQNRVRLLRLFRSLEVAFHASLFPADGLTSINDIGTRLALWVSAFEVLCHPGKGSVDKRHVQKLVSAAPYSIKELTARRYTISHQNKNFRVTLSEALYDDLYWARNQFLYGMPVRVTTLHYRQSKSYPLLANIAPVLFNAALVSYLDQIGIAGGPTSLTNFSSEAVALYMKSHEGIGRVQTGLAAAAKLVP